MAASDRELVRQDAASQRGVFVRHIHIDICGDYHAAALLSQILYWSYADEAGKSKLRVRKEGRLWLVKRFEDWYEECRLSADQARRAMATLRGLGIVETQTFRFNGSPTTHVRIRTTAYAAALRKAVGPPDGNGESARTEMANPPEPNGESARTLTGDYKQENTHKNIAAGAAVRDSRPRNGHAAHKPPGLLPQRSTRYRPAPKPPKLSAFDQKAGRKLKQMLERRGILLGRRCKADTFADCVRRLREFGRVSEEKLRDIIGWYAAHYHEDYVPQLRRGGDFFAKFDAIANARNKARFAGLAQDDIADLVEEAAQVRMRQRRPEVGLNYDYLEMDRIRDEVRAEWFGSTTVPAE